MALTVTQHAPSKELPSLSPEELQRRAAGDKLAIAAALNEAARRGLKPDGTRLAALVGPKTDEELLDAVEDLTGYHIPRVAVCTQHDHKAPAQTFCDLYFERVTDVLWIGNRGGGKTTNSGFLHGAKGRYHPGYTSAVAGAVERQGYRAYAEFKRFTRQLGSEVLDSLLSKTTWANGSETEVLGGTVRALNGPHPNLAQMDEVELTTLDALAEFLNMAQGNARYAGQQLLTSTRKKAHGIVQSIVAEVTQALRNDETPPWRVDIFCVFETMARVSNCRSAPENKGKPEAELCNCNTLKKGTWDDGTERRFDQVCGGRAYRSDGFVHLKDVQKRFKQLSRLTWESQQECLQPNIEGIVHKWVRDRHYLPTWLPHPEFGQIFRSWDWGGNNPHAVLFVQVLSVPVALDQDGVPILSEEDLAAENAELIRLGEPQREVARVLPEGSAVQFDEVYKTSDELPNDGGFSDLAFVVAQREELWRQYGFPMQIVKDFCDPAGFVGKREVRKEFKRLIATGEHPDLKVPSFLSVPAPVAESVRLHISWGESNKIYIAQPMCPHTGDEYDVYHWPDKKADKNLSEEPVKEDDHAMDAFRYFIWNYERMTARNAGRGELPAADERKPQAARTASPYAAPHVAPNNTAVGSPVGSPVGSLERGDTDPGRMRERPVPGIRQVVGPTIRR